MSQTKMKPSLSVFARILFVYLNWVGVYDVSMCVLANINSTDDHNMTIIKSVTCGTSRIWFIVLLEKRGKSQTERQKCDWCCCITGEVRHKFKRETLSEVTETSRVSALLNTVELIRGTERNLLKLKFWRFFKFLSV